MDAEDRYARTEALIGRDARLRLAEMRIAVFGVGGVGGWCAEALVRSGARHLTLVDFDRVAPSNLNRQCAATMASLGRPKVEAMRERLLAISPDAEIAVRDERFESVSSFGPLGAFEVIVDAIDDVKAKAELIIGATEAGVPLFSSMGAAMRTDPTKVAVRRFDKVEGDGLARALRQRFRRLGRFPAAKFACVCSTEAPLAAECRGSLMPVVGTFGLVLAEQVIELAYGGKIR